MKTKRFNYELVMEFSPKTEEKTKQPIIDKVEKWFESQDSKVVSKDHLGVKQLVYKIKDFDKADFWMLNIEGEKPIKLVELNLFLNREINVIRYLVIKK